MFLVFYFNRVNGHVPGLSGGQDSKSDLRKRKGKATSTTNMPNSRQLSGSPIISHQISDPPRSSSCNGQSKFADRLKGLRGLLLSNGDETYQNRADHSDLSDLEDPYAFNEPEPVRRYSNSSPDVKVVAKPPGKSVVKTKPDRGMTFDNYIDCNNYLS